ncbi:MAG: DNRLRE domain-containing protein, partial [Firmicutes bacterium]|nr:DNRLRE domain-containing protein [Bacillota bacterium]
MGIVPRQVYAEAGASFPPEEPGDLSQEYIDNSRPVSVEGEVTNLRSEDGKHFKLTDGTFLSVSYYEPIHYLDSEGNWQDIDNSLYLDKDGKSYSTKENGGHSFSLAKDLSSGELVTTFQGDFSVSMKLLGGYDETSAMEIRERGKEKPADETKSWTADDLMPRNLSSKVIYKDVFKDVDIEYTLHGFDLKEQIVLNEKGDQTSFDFLLSFEGLSATLSENGSVLLQDSEGTPIYTIPVPFMEDAMGRTSYDVWYELTETEDGIIFTVTAGSEWLSAEDRVYPVRIDPTLYARTTNNDNTSSANTYTTYTLSYYPGTGIGTWAGLPQHLFIGYDPSSGATRGYVHFHNLPSVPSGSEVIGAYYGIYLFSPYWDGYYGYYGVNSSQIPLELREVTSQKPSWYNSYYDWFINLSWNDQYSMSYGPIVDYEAADWGSAGGWLRWDVSGLAKKWYTEGTENRTVMICSSEESSYYDYYYAWIR